MIFGINLDTKVLLRHFSKLVCLATVFLIFAGGLVTSTGSGLSVPDWPLSYGMLFPPMVGGVFYEHGHRMVATVVGFLTLCLAILLWKFETRRWLKLLGFIALTAVIIQGILGGITVKYFLPWPISVSHAVLAQSFFVITIVIAYSLCTERESRLNIQSVAPRFLPISLFLIFCVFVQLILGAIMRHWHAGLAVPDFPTMGGEWWPKIDAALLNRINIWREDLNLDPVSANQVFIHLLHRCGALLVLLAALWVNIAGLKKDARPLVRESIWILDILIVLQIILGMTTVLSKKEYHITSLHVVTGAIVLGWSVLLFLRAAPIKLIEVKQNLSNDFKSAT